MGYDSELDTSPEPDPAAASYYLLFKLGRIDIVTRVLLLSSHVAFPREGQLDAAVHVMAHVGQRYNFRLVYDPLYQETDHSVFKKCDWSEIYRDAKDAISMNSPYP